MAPDGLSVDVQMAKLEVWQSLQEKVIEDNRKDISEAFRKIGALETLMVGIDHRLQTQETALKSLVASVERVNGALFKYFLLLLVGGSSTTAGLLKLLGG
jgi:hypothetical protein